MLNEEPSTDLLYYGYCPQLEMPPYRVHDWELIWTNLQAFIEPACWFTRCLFMQLGTHSTLTRTEEWMLLNALRMPLFWILWMNFAQHWQISGIRKYLLYRFKNNKLSTRKRNNNNNHNNSSISNSWGICCCCCCCALLVCLFV